MKKIFFSFLALLLIAGSISCYEKIDKKSIVVLPFVETEKEAIKTVIENETNYYYARDWDQQSKSFLQDESLIVLVSNKNGYTYVVGWEDISQGYKGFHKQNPNPVIIKIQFTNYKIKVYKESAWAVFDQVEHNSEDEFLRKYIRAMFLEKVDGEWKIAYLSHVITSSYDEEVEEGEEESETED